MNYSASVVSSAFWLAEPIVEVGWEQPKTKPVQTEVERRLWEIRRQTANPKKGWIDALVYTAFAGSSTASVAYAFQNLNELFAGDGLTNAVNKPLGLSAENSNLIFSQEQQPTPESLGARAWKFFWDSWWGSQIQAGSVSRRQRAGTPNAKCLTGSVLPRLDRSRAWQGDAAKI
jgi:hypothetical protein